MTGVAVVVRTRARTLGEKAVPPQEPVLGIDGGAGTTSKWSDVFYVFLDDRLDTVAASVIHEPEPQTQRRTREVMRAENARGLSRCARWVCDTEPG